MSRSLTNFLLLEDLFDNLDLSNRVVATLASQVFSPSVRIVQENCNTKLGRRIEISPKVNGLVKITFNGTLNPDRTIPDSDRISDEDIEELLAASRYIAYVRDLTTCTSMGGICAGCYASTFNTPAPVVGSFVQIQNQYILHTDSHLTSPSTTTYGLTVDPSLYDFKQVYLNNKVLSTSDYTETDTSIILNDIPGPADYLTINEVIRSNKPFMSYLSNTYSGDLLGIEAIATPPITLPLGVIDRGISPGQISQMTRLVENFSTIDQIQMDYCNSVTSKIEKALLLLVLFSLHNDIQT